MDRILSKHQYFALLVCLSAGGSLYGVTPSDVVINPATVTLTSQAGTPFPQIVNITGANGGAVSFTAAAISPGNFLTVSPASGTTPQAITITGNPGSLSTGTYAGYVNITTQNGVTAIPVSFNVNSSGSTPLSTLPGTLTFNFPPGTTTPATQTLTVNTNANVGTVAASAFSSNGSNFVSVNPSSTVLSPTQPGTFSVSVSPTGLATGTYNAVIALSPPGTTGTLVPVIVNIQNSSALSINPATLNFVYQTGTAAPPAQSINLTTNSATPLSFTAVANTTTCGTNWLVLSPLSGATPATITAQLNVANLQVGSCTGSIVISSPNAATPVQTIPVNLLVSNLPLLQVPTTGPQFTYQIGSGATLAAQNVSVTSTGAALTYTSSTAPVSGGPNFLTVGNGSGTTPGSLQLGITQSVLAGLAPGTYTQNVTVTSAGSGNTSATFPVTLVVSNNPILTASQTSANFNFQVGQAAPASQVINLSSTGIPLNYTVTTSTTNCTGFLSATPATGSTGGQAGQNGQVVVSVNTTGITTPGTCTGTLTISVPNSVAAPVTIPVTLTTSTSPLLNVSPAVILGSAVAGTATTTQQNVSLTSTDGKTPLGFTALAATNPAGLTWLSVSPNTGSSPANLTVTLNPTGLLPGVYQGSITLTSTTPNVPTQTIPVIYTVASGAITAAPVSLNFAQSVGGPVPASQTITIGGIPTGATVGAVATAFNGGNFLTVTQGATPGTLTVTATGGTLTQGIYQGVITVIVPGANPSPLYVPVTFTVGTPQSLAVSATNLTFSYAAGSGTTPASQTVQLTSTGGNVPFTAAVSTANGTPFLTVSPASGTTPATLTIGLSQSALTNLVAGTYNGTVTVSSPNVPNGTQTINVALTVTTGIGPTVTAVQNAATFLTGPVSPGEIITLGGTNIGPTAPANLTLTATGSVATTLGGTQVTFDGVPAALIYVSANQINAIVPYEVAGKTSTNIVVVRNGISSASMSQTVAATSPGIFTASQNGTGQGAILNQNGSVNNTATPAAKGSVIAIYATGEGQINPAGVTGSVTASTGTTFPLPVGAVTLTIGGVPAQILYAGEAPSLVSGVLQVNAIIPSGVTSGNQPIVLKVGSASSPSVATVAVQ